MDQIGEAQALTPASLTCWVYCASQNVTYIDRLVGSGSPCSKMLSQHWTVDSSCADLRSATSSRPVEPDCIVLFARRCARPSSGPKRFADSCWRSMLVV